jgi:hypothetical protein
MTGMIRFEGARSKSRLDSNQNTGYLERIRILRQSRTSRLKVRSHCPCSKDREQANRVHHLTSLPRYRNTTKVKKQAQAGEPISRTLDSQLPNKWQKRKQTTPPVEKNQRPRLCALHRHPLIKQQLQRRNQCLLTTSERWIWLQSWMRRRRSSRTLSRANSPNTNLL